MFKSSCKERCINDEDYGLCVGYRCSDAEIKDAKAHFTDGNIIVPVIAGKVRCFKRMFLLGSAAPKSGRAIEGQLATIHSHQHALNLIVGVWGSRDAFFANFLPPGCTSSDDSSDGSSGGSSSSDDSSSSDGSSDDSDSTYFPSSSSSGSSSDSDSSDDDTGSSSSSSDGSSSAGSSGYRPSDGSDLEDDSDVEDESDFDDSDDDDDDDVDMGALDIAAMVNTDAPIDITADDGPNEALVGGGAVVVDDLKIPARTELHRWMKKLARAQTRRVEAMAAIACNHSGSLARYSKVMERIRRCQATIAQLREAIRWRRALAKAEFFAETELGRELRRAVRRRCHLMNPEATTRELRTAETELTRLTGEVKMTRTTFDRDQPEAYVQAMIGAGRVGIKIAQLRGALARAKLNHVDDRKLFSTKPKVPFSDVTRRQLCLIDDWFNCHPMHLFRNVVAKLGNFRTVTNLSADPGNHYETDYGSAVLCRSNVTRGDGSPACYVMHNGADPGRENYHSQLFGALALHLLGFQKDATAILGGTDDEPRLSRDELEARIMYYDKSIKNGGRVLAIFYKKAATALNFDDQEGFKSVVAEFANHYLRAGEHKRKNFQAKLIDVVPLAHGLVVPRILIEDARRVASAIASDTTAIAWAPPTPRWIIPQKIIDAEWPTDGFAIPASTCHEKLADEEFDETDKQFGQVRTSVSTMRRVVQCVPGFHGLDVDGKRAALALYFARDHQIRSLEAKHSGNLIIHSNQSSPKKRTGTHGTDRPLECTICGTSFYQCIQKDVTRGNFFVKHSCVGSQVTNMIWMLVPPSDADRLTIQGMGPGACILNVWLETINVLGELVYPSKRTMYRLKAKDLLSSFFLVADTLGWPNRQFRDLMKNKDGRSSARFFQEIIKILKFLQKERLCPSNLEIRTTMVQKGTKTNNCNSVNVVGYLPQTADDVLRADREYGGFEVPPCENISFDDLESEMQQRIRRERSRDDDDEPECDECDMDIDDDNESDRDSDDDNVSDMDVDDDNECHMNADDDNEDVQPRRNSWASDPERGTIPQRKNPWRKARRSDSDGSDYGNYSFDSDPEVEFSFD